MIYFRQIYQRHLRGTALGNAIRHVWHWILLLRSAPAIAVLPNKLRSRLRSAYDQAIPFFYRAAYVARYYWPRIRPVLPWLARSREMSNFTFDLTPRNENHLAQMLAVVLRRPVVEIAGYIDELKQDHALKDAIACQVRMLGRQGGYDPVARFGRRIGWYAVVRAMKPKVVVETGVEKGMGAMVLCAALIRNAQEGSVGRYFGTDIDPGAGRLLSEPYNAMGKVLYGDSIASLSNLNVPVDIFINDSDHSAEYEAREYLEIAPRLSERAIILGDNAHVSDELLKFSVEKERQFLFFREEPENHWYLGAGIGISFKALS